METNCDFLQLVRSCYAQETRGRQIAHVYTLSNWPAIQPADPSAPPTCPRSSEGSTLTNRHSGKDSSRFTSVSLQIAGQNAVDAEGCRLIAEARWPRLQLLSLAT
jgi:hypothetical protein